MTIQAQTPKQKHRGPLPPTTGQTLLRFLLIFLVSKPISQLVTMTVGGAIFSEPSRMKWLDLLFLFTFIVYIAGVWFTVRFREKRNFSDLELSWHARGISCFLAFALIGILLVLLILIGLSFSGIYSFQNRGEVDFLYIFIGFLAYFTQGSAEELLIRGYLYHGLQKNIGEVWAFVLSSLFFALPHLLTLENPLDFQTPVIFLNLILISALFTQVMILQHSLWASIGLHVGWNFSLGILCGGQVSGMEAGGGVFPFEQVDANIMLTGGRYGMEGSILLIPVCLCMIFFIHKLIQQKGKNFDGFSA